ncbi:MAG: STAS domain-containing protein [Legionella sp.]|uniref:STAS domain-containing protein n=1 Tax=Legionella sp. TaxID=459 RepID=UPI00283F15BA|nr:STAS domain-containing protein [Legionella sp.]
MNTAHFKPLELSFKSVVEVRAQLYKTLMDDTSNHLVLDLSEVTHCDSAGMALLIEARKLCKKNNKTFEIIGMSAETESLADFCGVKDILEVV